MPSTYKNVPAIKKCFAILELLSNSENPLGISEISRKLDINKSTVFNMVYTLVDLQVLDECGDGKFAFGHYLYTLGKASGKGSELIRIVHPYLKRINQETKLSVFLGIRSDLKTVLIDKVDSAYIIKISSEIGMQMPVLGGVGIKAMLSQLSRDHIAELIDDVAFKRYTPNTILKKSEYLKELETICEQGIAFDREEYIEGIAAIGVPIKTHNRRIQAAIWVVGLKRQLLQESSEDVENLLKNTALEINQRLGL